MRNSNFNTLLVLFFFLTTSAPLFAQFGMGKIEEIEAVQARKLIVMIEEPRERMLNKIAKRPKKGTVEDYRADLKVYNENIKTVVEKFWPYNKNIQYKTYNEIMELRKTKTVDYAVVACLSTEPRTTSAGYNYAQGLYWVKDIKEDFEDRNDAMFTVMLVNTIEDFGKKPVFLIPLFDVFPTKASLVYGIKNIESYFDLRIKTKKNGAKMKDEQDRLEAEIAKRAPMLATQKTLLIREEWLDKELTESNIKTFYPYKYKICDREFMDKAVMDLDANYAYGVVLPQVMSSSHSNYILYIQYVIDAADSQMMCFVRPTTGGSMLASSVTGKAGNRNFTIKVMTKIVEQIKGKRN